MENIKIIVSGPFKEKALIVSVLGDKLEDEGIDVTYADAVANSLVRSRHDNVLSELRQSDAKVSLVVENLINTNVTEDLKLFLDDLKSPYWSSGSPDFTRAVKTVESRLRQILMM